MNVKLILKSIPLLAGLIAAAPAFSETITLDFEGIANTSPVGNFYSGSGVTFGADALAFVNDAFTTYFTHSPSPGAALSAVGSDAALNLAAGFTGTASFFYSSSAATSVSIYSGLNGTGSLLGTFNLAANATTGCVDSAFCHWDLASVNFSGVAQSIQFGSTYDSVNFQSLAGFDNVTVNAVPVPAAIWLMISGLGGLGAMMRRKRNA